MGRPPTATKASWSFLHTKAKSRVRKRQKEQKKKAKESGDAKDRPELCVKKRGTFEHIKEKNY